MTCSVKDEFSSPHCPICPHRCAPSEGERGICGARVRRGDRILSESYGYITSLALDPIEKKPLARFYPGAKILSAGSYGCNLFCSFCQNASISRGTLHSTHAEYISPASLVARAIETKNSGGIGIAFTYNEPLVGYEYVLDTSILAKKSDLKTVLVTNGYINEEPLRVLLPYIDAMNIDLKAPDDTGYKSLGGHLAPVLSTIEKASRCCHVEVTSLIVPGLNDTEDAMRQTAAQIARIDRNIPLHVSRFFPRYHMTDTAATPAETIRLMQKIAKEQLSYVYTGNL